MRSLLILPNHDDFIHPWGPAAASIMEQVAKANDLISSLKVKPKSATGATDGTQSKQTRPNQPRPQAVVPAELLQSTSVTRQGQPSPPQIEHGKSEATGNKDLDIKEKVNVTANSVLPERQRQQNDTLENTIQELRYCFLQRVKVR